ncbi:MAG: hypothetical protein MGU50_24285 [Trichodesmium sp. MAG_R02]|jgi:hypothetical protein|nr:hypothetical protein [Trichodesmium sp. MAG_R02]
MVDKSELVIATSQTQNPIPFLIELLFNFRTRGACRLRIIQKNHIACAMERVELVKKICLRYRQKYLSRTAMNYYQNI